MNKKKAGAETSAVEGFEWPSYRAEMERIKENSQAFKDISIEDAFKKSYGIKIKKSKTRDSEVPYEVKIGETIKLNVASVSKGNVVFEVPTSIKEPIVSNVDLYKYPVFKKYLPKEPIDVKVVGRNFGNLVVDPIQPLIEKWETRVLTDTSNQATMDGGRWVEVSNLKWMPAGYTGTIEIPEVSEFTGQKSTVEAFIPGSHIVLNIERDFSKWQGKNVKAFVTNKMIKPSTTNQVSVVCSVKKYLENLGNIFKINLFKSYTENGNLWKENLETRYRGVVTGVIHTSKKCGVFVELPDVQITGLVKTSGEVLSQYHPGDEVEVRITDFDEIKKYDSFADQMKHVIPYVVSEEGVIKECNLKPVLEFA